MDDESDVPALRKAISRITGRATVSKDRRYLQNRLAELRRGVRVPTSRVPVGRHAVPMSVSMTPARIELVTTMADRASLSTSKLVQRALDEYAAKHGFGAPLQRILHAERIQ